MKLTQEKILELLWENDGYSQKVGSSSPDFNGTKRYMVFGAKLFVNRFGKDTQTGEQIFETREADAEETKKFLHMQIMCGKFRTIEEEPKPDFSKMAAVV